MLDVGAGEAILLSVNREAALIDGGAKHTDENTEVASQLLNWINKARVNVKLFIASHPHQDHLNALYGPRGLLNKLRQQGKLRKTSKYYHNGTTPNEFSRRLLNQVKELGLQTIVPARNHRENLGSKATIDLFMNGKTAHGEDYRSVIAHLNYGNASFLFTGDVYADYERKLLDDDLQRSRSLLKAQVLKVTHHGSKGGTSPAFVKYVRPILAIASTAKRPDGKPDLDHNVDPSTSDTLRKLRVKVFETAKSGTITVETDGVKQRRGILFEITTAR